jgi:hypothetical protein
MMQATRIRRDTDPGLTLENAATLANITQHRDSIQEHRDNIIKYREQRDSITLASSMDVLNPTIFLTPFGSLSSNSDSSSISSSIDMNNNKSNKSNSNNSNNNISNNNSTTINSSTNTTEPGTLLPFWKSLSNDNISNTHGRDVEGVSPTFLAGLRVCVCVCVCVYSVSICSVLYCLVFS